VTKPAHSSCEHAWSRSVAARSIDAGSAHLAAEAATIGRSAVHRLYEWQGRAHAALAKAARDAHGQGTVEYVGLILLVAVILAGVVKASGGLKDSTIAEAVIKKLKGAIDSVGEGK
jgi:hypothetical protein